MTQHPGPLPASSSPSWERTGAPPPRPATVHAAAVLLAVLAALMGLLAALVLGHSVAGTLTDAGAPGDAPPVGWLVGDALVAGAPLALAALHAWMALSVRAGRTWPVRVTTVLAGLVGTALVVNAPGGLWTAGQRGGLLLTVALLAQVVLVLGLQVVTVVLLHRPSARAWAARRVRG